MITDRVTEMSETVIVTRDIARKGEVMINSGDTSSIIKGCELLLVSNLFKDGKETADPGQLDVTKSLKRGLNTLQTSPYEVLSVPIGSRVIDVRKAYRKLALQYHPDKNPKTTLLFQVIQSSCDRLTDPALRAKEERQANARQASRSTNPRQPHPPTYNYNATKQQNYRRHHPNDDTNKRKQYYEDLLREQYRKAEEEKKKASWDKVNNKAPQQPSYESFYEKLYQNRQPKAPDQPQPSATEKPDYYNRNYYQSAENQGPAAGTSNAQGAAPQPAFAGRMFKVGPDGKPYPSNELYNQYKNQQYSGKPDPPQPQPSSENHPNGAHGKDNKANMTPKKRVPRPYGLNCLSLGEKQVELEWRTSDIYKNPLLVELSWKNCSTGVDIKDNSWQSANKLISGGQCRKKNLEPGGTYEFRLRAVEDLGGGMLGYRSEWCEPLSLTLLPATKPLYKTGLNGTGKFQNTAKNTMKYAQSSPKSSDTGTSKQQQEDSKTNPHEYKRFKNETTDEKGEKTPRPSNLTSKNKTLSASAREAWGQKSTADPSPATPPVRRVNGKSTAQTRKMEKLDGTSPKAAKGAAADHNFGIDAEIVEEIEHPAAPNSVVSDDEETAEVVHEEILEDGTVESSSHSLRKSSKQKKETGEEVVSEVDSDEGLSAQKEKKKKKKRLSRQTSKKGMKRRSLSKEFNPFEDDEEEEEEEVEGEEQKLYDLKPPASFIADANQASHRNLRDKVSAAPYRHPVRAEPFKRSKIVGFLTYNQTDTDPVVSCAECGEWVKVRVHEIAPGKVKNANTVRLKRANSSSKQVWGWCLKKNENSTFLTPAKPGKYSSPSSLHKTRSRSKSEAIFEDFSIDKDSSSIVDESGLNKLPHGSASLDSLHSPCPSRPRSRMPVGERSHHFLPKVPSQPSPVKNVKRAGKIDVWLELFDNEGNVYYYNESSGESQWEPPEWIEESDPLSGAKYYVKLSNTHNSTDLHSTWTQPQKFARLIRASN